MTKMLLLMSKNINVVFLEVTLRHTLIELVLLTNII